MKTKLFTPVERIDGIAEKRNMAEKHMHLYRYQHAAGILKNIWGSSAKKHILDIACGLGYGSRELHTATGAEVTGVDISEEAIQYANRHYRSGRDISFKQGNLTTIPSPDAAYDAVVCYETIEHISHAEGLVAIEELSRVLKPGGTLFISTPNRIYTYLLQLIGMRNPFHVYEYMPRELRNEVSHKGFSHVATYGQSLCFPITYYVARNGWLPSKYFYPSRYLPAELSMIAILQFVKD